MSDIQRYDPPPSPEEQAGLLRSLFDRTILTWRLFWDRRVGFLPKLIPLAGLAYIISPVDLLPVLLTGPIGVLDDLGAAGLMLATLGLFIQMAPPDVVREHLRELGASIPHFLEDSGPAADYSPDDVIDGTAEVIND